MSFTQKLDMIFPFVVFGYGFVMCVVLNQPRLMELAESKLPQEILTQFKSHRALGLLCLVVGTFWSLQTIWLN